MGDVVSAALSAGTDQQQDTSWRGYEGQVSALTQSLHCMASWWSTSSHS